MLSSQSDASLEHAVDVWYLPVRAATTDLDTAYGSVLSDGERRRATRFRRDADRRLFTFSRVGLRILLSRYCDVPPDRWVFDADPLGKPRIAAPAGATGLVFNLSHTRGLVAWVVGRRRSVGVDAEHIRRAIDFSDIAARHFTPAERLSIDALADDDRPSGFFTIWTLKEAVLKASGVGLTVDLSALSFESTRHPIGFKVSGATPVDSTRWQCARFLPTRDHVVAVCAGRAPRVELDVRVRELSPRELEEPPVSAASA